MGKKLIGPTKGPNANIIWYRFQKYKLSPYYELLERIVKIMRPKEGFIKINFDSIIENYDCNSLKDIYFEDGTIDQEMVEDSRIYQSGIPLFLKDTFSNSVIESIKDILDYSLISTESKKAILKAAILDLASYPIEHTELEHMQDDYLGSGNYSKYDLIIHYQEQILLVYDSFESKLLSMYHSLDEVKELQYQKKPFTEFNNLSGTRKALVFIYNGFLIVKGKHKFYNKWSLVNTSDKRIKYKSSKLEIEWMIKHLKGIEQHIDESGSQKYKDELHQLESKLEKHY